MASLQAARAAKDDLRLKLTSHGIGATAVRGQDLANVVLGAITMTATFLLGKIIVNSIIESRKEHFDAKGQPPAAVKAKETTVDGIVKVLSMGYSMYMLSQELPIVLKEAEKLLK